MSENGRAAPVHDAERISDLGFRELGNGPVRRPVHRHRRRAVDRQRPEHVQLAPAEHEEHPARRDRPLAGADRRVRNRNRAGHRRRDRRGGTGKAGAEALLRSHHDPLLEPEILRQQRRGHPQRRDDVRRAEHPAAVPARNGQAGQLVRDRDRPEDRAARGDHPQCGGQGRQRPRQYRAAAARDRARPALLGAEARQNTTDREACGRAGRKIPLGTGNDSGRAEPPDQGSEERGQADHLGGQQADRADDPHDPRVAGR